MTNDRSVPTGGTGHSAPPPPPPPPSTEAKVVGGWPGQWPVPRQPLPYARTNGLAVASLVLSLVWLGGLGALLAAIFGHVAMGQINRSEGNERGHGMALAGTIIGWIGVFLAVAMWVNVAQMADDPYDYYDY